jgi:Zn-dependent protease with chaperone function
MDIISAKYFDGHSSQAHIIHCSLDNNAIILETAEGHLTWPFETLIILERPHENKAAVFSSTQQAEARLIIDDVTVYRAIAQHILSKNINVSHVHHPWRILVIVTGLIAAILIFSAWGVPYYAPWLAKKIPSSWDDHLGQWVISSVADNKNVCTNEAGVKALKKLRYQLSRNQKVEEDFDIQVVDFNFINAFSVPGFHIVLAKGLIDAAESPDEVAGVLAHEMAHSIQHHPTAGLITEIGLGVIISAAFGTSPDFGVKMLNFSYSRKYEFEADKIGTQLLNQANISADGLITFFHRISSDSQDIEKYFKYVSTHPPSQERIEKINQYNQVLNPRPSLTLKEWQALQNICQEKKPFKF